MSNEDKILKYLERIYRISKYRLICKLEEEEMGRYVWALNADKEVRKILPDLDGYIKRKKQRMDELADCCPWIGDIIHEKEELPGEGANS